MHKNSFATSQGYVTNGWIEIIDNGRDGVTYVWHAAPTQYENLCFIGSSYQESVGQTMIYRTYCNFQPYSAVPYFFPRQLILRWYTGNVTGSQTLSITSFSSNPIGMSASDLYNNIKSGTVYATTTMGSPYTWKDVPLNNQAILDSFSHPTWFSVGIWGSESGENFISINSPTIVVVGGGKPTQ